ncbi:hypothetical protein ACFO1B_26175 [Dactylosporangium siamense]|uniref:Uncharacterized protein n=1 Tax=Dactylosporangium siamense TaxID=685454 RepID=A0A919PQK9_9ACTN|nr:hypothetical protein [Dactylosporangium siamense]GIG46503.1 hypothetical protein Dsi01nite_045440 [Dactylosporangium siamense]
MDLTQAMLAATANPPPTGIDVDQLITGERRRTRRLHAVTGVAVAAALAAGMVALPQLLPQKPSGQSPGLAPPSTATRATRSPAACVTPSPTVNVPPGGKETVQPRPVVPVTESCGAAIARLSDVLTALLPGLVPGATFTNARDGSPLPANVERSGPPAIAYNAGFNVQNGVMSVKIEASEETPAQYRPFAREQCAIPEAHCRSATIGGAELLIRSSTEYGIDVWAVRPDGVLLLALTRSRTPGQPTPLTEQQLIDIVLDPALTMYP